MRGDARCQNRQRSGSQQLGAPRQPTTAGAPDSLDNTLFPEKSGVNCLIDAPAMHPPAVSSQSHETPSLRGLYIAASVIAEG